MLPPLSDRCQTQHGASTLSFVATMSHSVANTAKVVADLMQKLILITDKVAQRKPRQK